MQFRRTECADRAAAADGAPQHLVMHQYQLIIAHGHHVEFDGRKTQRRAMTQRGQRVLRRKRAAAPVRKYPRISPHAFVPA